MHEGYQTQVADPDRMYEEIAVDYLRGMMFHNQPDVLTDEVLPGCRFPHRWVAPGLSTLDILGTRWTRLDGDEEWLAAAGLSVEGPLSVRPDGIVE